MDIILKDEFEDTKGASLFIIYCYLFQDYSSIRLEFEVPCEDIPIYIITYNISCTTFWLCSFVKMTKITTTMTDDRRTSIDNKSSINL
jgi:hypothetical protein